MLPKNNKVPRLVCNTLPANFFLLQSSECLADKNVIHQLFSSLLAFAELHRPLTEHYA